MRPFGFRSKARSASASPSGWPSGCFLWSNIARATSVLFTNSVGICGNGFLVQTRRERRAYPSAVCKERTTKSEPKRHAAHRVAPHLAFGFVAPRSQIAADMLPRRAAPKAKCGATNAHPICEQHTSVVWLRKQRAGASFFPGAKPLERSRRAQRFHPGSASCAQRSPSG